MSVLANAACEKVGKSLNKNHKEMQKVLIIGRELEFARALAGNDVKLRNRALKSLRKWFETRAKTIVFSEADFMRLWKGLFYSMWMSDKPLVQEECAESISGLVHFLPPENALLFYQCGLKTLKNEFFGLDQLRMDKFLMLVRRQLRHILMVIKKENWPRKLIQSFNNAINHTVFDQNTNSLSLVLHFIEIFMEELAKVSEEQLEAHKLAVFLEPFVVKLARSDDERVLQCLKKNIFIYLIRQSDLGLEYEAKYAEWKRLGFPGTINCIQKVEIDEEDSEEDGDAEEEEESSEKVLDPRAGRVNVDLPQLKFSPKHILKLLDGVKYDKQTNRKSRYMIGLLIDHFTKMREHIYPLGTKKLNFKQEQSSYRKDVRKAAKKLLEFNGKLMRNGHVPMENGDEELTTLKSGKKVKLNHDFQEKVGQLFENDVRLKRKLLDRAESERMRKQRKIEMLQEQIETEQANIESKFERNSGTWFVSLNEKRKRDEEMAEKAAGDLFEKDNDWETSSSSSSANFFANELKKVKLTQKSVKKSAEKFATRRQKHVKIDTSLNQSQEFHEHHEEIRKKPQIPFDADRKPPKPVLKLKNSASFHANRINPFY